MFWSLSLIALFFTAPVVAQTASVNSYGSPCPDPTYVLTTQGQLPRLGTTLSIPLPSGCKNNYPPACWDSLLLVGLSRSTRIFSAPGISSGNGCTILVSPDAVVAGDANRNANLVIPNQTRFLGFRFNIQMVTLSTRGFFGNHVAFSDGLECVIGP